MSCPSPIPTVENYLGNYFENCQENDNFNFYSGETIKQNEYIMFNNSPIIHHNGFLNTHEPQSLLNFNSNQNNKNDIFFTQKEKNETQQNILPIKIKAKEVTEVKMNPKIKEILDEKKNKLSELQNQNSLDSKKTNSTKNSEEENNKINLQEKINFLSFSEIKNKYVKNYKLEKIRKMDLVNDILIGGKKTEDLEKNFGLKLEKKYKIKLTKKKILEKKRNREKNEKDDNFNDSNMNNEEKEKKAKNNPVHDIFSQDNQVDKFQTHFYNWILFIINQFIPEKHLKILKLSNKLYKKRKNKEYIGYLDMKACDFFSKEISHFYSSKIRQECGKDININNIKQLQWKEDLKKLLDLKIQDFLDIYRYKENKDEIINKIGIKFYENINTRIEKFLDELFNGKNLKKIEVNEKDYISSHLVMIYNYEIWLSLRNSRKREKNNKDSNHECKKQDNSDNLVIAIENSDLKNQI